MKMLKKKKCDEGKEEVIKDLKDTLRVNDRILDDFGNEMVCLDVDHIDYLIKTLEGNNNDKEERN